jgi:hypothetical protein
MNDISIEYGILISGEYDILESRMEESKSLPFLAYDESSECWSFCDDEEEYYIEGHPHCAEVAPGYKYFVTFGKDSSSSTEPIFAGVVREWFKSKEIKTEWGTIHTER